MKSLLKILLFLGVPVYGLHVFWFTIILYRKTLTGRVKCTGLDLWTQEHHWTSWMLFRAEHQHLIKAFFLDMGANLNYFNLLYW